MSLSQVDYKSAKEAFVADNPGSTIWSIQLTSLAALSGYILYSVLSKRLSSPILDYATTIFPLLIGVTSLSSHPYALNVALLGCAWAIHAFRPREVQRRPMSKRSQGKWLDESDSDEEPSQPVYASSTSTSWPLSRLSTSSSAASSSANSPVDPPSAITSSAAATATTSTSSPDRLGTPEISRRAFKRRHSPTPSTHTHTAIEILQTPETDKFPIDQNPEYPPHPRARTNAAGALGTGTDLRGSGRAGGTLGNAGSTRLPFLSVYRAHMMIMTILCILAVDFPIFPRTQGKCEDFGTSLMDVGVGSFVFSLGLVTSRSSTSSSTPKGNMFFAVLKALKKAAPVLILGLVRVVMVKGAEYPEHVTEYGVHWNFFFTLGFLPVLGILISPLQRYVGWTPLALLTALVHQVALSTVGLESWVMSPVRHGLIGMNKEGIVSLPGYLAIYTLGLGIGQHILRDPATDGSKRGVSETAEEHLRSRMDKRRTESAMELFGYSVGWWVLLTGLRLAGQQVSRRMANLPYILWTAAYNTTFLLGYLTVEIVFFPSSTGPTAAVPPLLDAINRNGLAFFLICNLATGLVNVSMETMYASDTVAIGVLIVYSATVCGLAWAGRGFRLKV